MSFNKQPSNPHSAKERPERLPRRTLGRHSAAGQGDAEDVWVHRPYSSEFLLGMGGDVRHQGLQRRPVGREVTVYGDFAEAAGSGGLPHILYRGIVLRRGDEMRPGGLMPGYTQSKDELRGRLRRVEGQVRGLQRMVDDDAYCIDVLTQISAVNAALRKVAVALLDDHLRHCVRDAASDDVRSDAIVTEATAAIDRLLKS